MDDADWATLPVPGCWQLHGYGTPNYTNTNYPFPVDPPYVPTENPVGIYRTSFSIPADWDGRSLFLVFEGVCSFFEVWVNGQFVGMSKGSHIPAEFDITGAAQAGENVLAVRVLQWSDASYLEDQDMWRLNGIFRDVYLLARSPVSLRDVAIKTWAGDGEELKVSRADVPAPDAPFHLRVTADILHSGSASAEGYTVSASLCDADGTEVLAPSVGEDVAVASPHRWTAETPYLYTLLVTLTGPDGASQQKCCRSPSVSATFGSPTSNCSSTASPSNCAGSTTTTRTRTAAMP